MCVNNRLYKITTKIIILLYIIGIVGVLSIIAIINVTKQAPRQELKEQTYQNISYSWTLDRAGTKPVGVKELGKYMDKESGVLSIYYKLPEMNKDMSLVYRSKDVYTKILIEDTILYETSVYNSKLYNKSPGNLWNILTINSKYSEKVVEIQIFMVYDTNAITVDSLLLGDKADIILGLFAENIFGIVISLLLILLGVVLFVIDILPSYGRIKKNHGLCWIGIFALLTGIWSLIETNVVQFCVKDVRILQLIDNIIITIDTIPLILYLNIEYKILQSKWIRLLAYIGTVYILICIAIQYIGTRDWHYVLNGSLYIMMLTDASLCIYLVLMIINRINKKQPVLNCILQAVGLCSLCSCSIFETIRTINNDKMDRAGLIRIGMLILCVCFAIASQIETYKIVEQGLKYDLISKLAYSDGLTGLGNRTAYLEQLDEYQNNQRGILELGIIYLDVNNLKAVNDNLGHEFGDELITTAAKIIQDSFKRFGKSYRIGGDEFCVLMLGAGLKNDYLTGLNIFNQLIEHTNKESIYTYKVQIAHGFTICDDFSMEKIEEAIASADSKMYENKKKLKEQNS